MTNNVEMSVKYGSLEPEALNDAVFDAYCHNVWRDMAKDAKRMVRDDQMPWDERLNQLVTKGVEANPKLIIEHSSC